VTPRGTDWSLAWLVALGFATGALTLFAGARGDAWVFAVHGVAGIALAVVLTWKLRRVRPRLRPARWDRRTAAGVAALALVGAALGAGWAWGGGARVYPGGYSLLAWHEALGFGLGALVLAHAALRAKRPRVRDVAGRRQFLIAAGVAGGSFAAWQLQRPAYALLGWRGARRRFTGSYEVASFEGNAFPATSWVADHPRELPRDRYRLRVDGLVARPLALTAADLDAGDALRATLDCTGGFYSTQHWRGIRLDRLLARAAPRARATHVRVVSHTGYRWTWSLEDAHRLLLATHVSGEELSHDHGAPARLVAPDHRGFQWVKWVTRLELRDGPDPTAVAATVWSSFTPEGRGAA
jgi:DMSO/TMAO reductase YedYZ molybdopterin-dependent catalytic subunit